MQGPQKKKPLVLEQRQSCRWRVPGHCVAAALQDTAVVFTWQPRPGRAFHLPQIKSIRYIPSQNTWVIHTALSASGEVFCHSSEQSATPWPGKYAGVSSIAAERLMKRGCFRIESVVRSRDFTCFLFRSRVQSPKIMRASFLRNCRGGYCKFIGTLPVVYFTTYG